MYEDFEEPEAGYLMDQLLDYDDADDKWSIANGFGYTEDDAEPFMKTRKGRTNINHL
ncbi:hypothetical protein [Streptomyces sp. NPDC127112]|uniref:hypothetical protein n=1 Tax=Streptomyces sp. NPDC127112 TaxID=3345364 RepID=UPI003631C541